MLKLSYPLHRLKAHCRLAGKILDLKMYELPMYNISKVTLPEWQ